MWDGRVKRESMGARRGELEFMHVIVIFPPVLLRAAQCAYYSRKQHGDSPRVARINAPSRVDVDRRSCCRTSKCPLRFARALARSLVCSLGNATRDG